MYSNSTQLWEAAIGWHCHECECSFQSFCTNAHICHPSMDEGGVEGVIVGVLLAVGVIYHAVDMDLFAHVHGQDEREPASAEVGAGLDPANTHRQLF